MMLLTQAAVCLECVPKTAQGQKPATRAWGDLVRLQSTPCRPQAWLATGAGERNQHPEAASSHQSEKSFGKPTLEPPAAWVDVRRVFIPSPPASLQGCCWLCTHRLLSVHQESWQSVASFDESRAAGVPRMAINLLARCK
ncbi:hypothetical protein NDU88_007606 [Pleurodeles waltl]|uniref:Uncharacterized protein n=1 Tax=Pleurodeles waltl TaxID=8319 RepID=A0AAV7U159_PLEWA|nr:hypothetical protein NDU88_007606 [Pleurodeles waltl]